MASQGKGTKASSRALTTTVQQEPVGCQYRDYICDTAERIYTQSNLANARFANSREVAADATSGVLYSNMHAVGVYDPEDMYEIKEELVRLWDERH